MLLLSGGGGYYGGGAGCRGGGGGGSSYFNATDRSVKVLANIVGGAVGGSGFVVVSYFSASSQEVAKPLVSKTFTNSTYESQVFVVPTGVSYVLLQLNGAQGGGFNGGLGGVVVAKLLVSGGDIFSISVGQSIRSGSCKSVTVGGGGTGQGTGGCGGGKTTVSSSTGITLIAGGGGGGSPSGAGGLGGGTIAGTSVCSQSCATGGTQSSGGSGGRGNS